MNLTSKVSLEMHIDMNNNRATLSNQLAAQSTVAPTEPLLRVK